MTTFRELPKFDDDGLNLLDPNDKSGRKSEYISLVHEEALFKYLGAGKCLALDLACGYGRMSNVLANLGYRVIGLDRSLRVLRPTREIAPNIPFCNGALPDMPFADGTFGVILMQNLLRVFHQLGKLEIAWPVCNYLERGGRLIIVENSWPKHVQFVDEDQLITSFEQLGLRLTGRYAIRSGRWLGVLMINFGLIPRRWWRAIARWEVRRMALRKKPSKFSYQNILFVFEKP